MRDLRFKQMTTDARSLADRLGSQTTEALIRAVSGVQQTSSEGLSTAAAGAAAVGGQIGEGITGGVQTLALPNTSARMAWRAGRFVGRIEGAVRLASFGVRFWWRRRQRGGQEQTAPQWTHMLVQWGPTAIASACLAERVWSLIRRRAAST